MTRARRVRRLLALGTGAILLLSPFPAAAAAARTITFSGASSAHPLTAELVRLYRRETPRAPRFSIVGGGTATGIADAARGVVSAGLVDRPLHPDDPRGLRHQPVALSALCLAAHPATPVTNVDRTELAHLPAAAAHADRSLLRAAFPEATAALPAFATSAQVGEFVRATPTAWGFVDLADAHGLNVVAIDGLPCSPAAPYPARRAYGFVTRGRPRGALARFLRWVARDATAQRAIASRYQLP